MRVAVCQVNSRDDRAANLAAARDAARAGRGRRRRPGRAAGVRRLSRPGRRRAEARAGRRGVRGHLRRGRARLGHVGARPVRSTRPDRTTPTRTTRRWSSTAPARWPRRTGRSTCSTSTSRTGSPTRSPRTVAPGDRVSSTVDVEGVRVGLSICYDLRFPELYRRLADRRRPGAAGAGRVHHPHRPRPLGGAAAGPGDREPVLRGRGRPDRRPRPGPQLLRPQHGDRPVGDRGRAGADASASPWPTSTSTGSPSPRACRAWPTAGSDRAGRRPTGSLDRAGPMPAAAIAARRDADTTRAGSRIVTPAGRVPPRRSEPMATGRRRPVPPADGRDQATAPRRPRDRLA